MGREERAAVLLREAVVTIRQGILAAGQALASRSPLDADGRNRFARGQDAPWYERE